MDDHPMDCQLAQTIPVAEMDVEKDGFQLAQLALVAEMKKHKPRSRNGRKGCEARCYLLRILKASCKRKPRAAEEGC